MSKSCYIIIIKKTESMLYLYIDNKTTLTNQIENLQEEVIVLRSDYKKLNDKFIETLKNINGN